MDALLLSGKREPQPGSLAGGKQLSAGAKHGRGRHDGRGHALAHGREGCNQGFASSCADAVRADAAQADLRDCPLVEMADAHAQRFRKAGHGKLQINPMATIHDQSVADARDTSCVAIAGCGTWRAA